MRRAFQRRVWAGNRPNFSDPLDLIADVRAVKDTADDYLSGAWGPDEIRQADPAVKKWERDVLLRVRLASKYTSTNSTTDWLRYILGTPQPQGSFPVCGLANIEDCDALRMSTAWKQLVEAEGEGRVDMPTTLGRIESSLARRLIVRGYLNTYLVSLFLAPLEDGEINSLAELPNRLDRIVEAQSLRT